MQIFAHEIIFYARNGFDIQDAAASRFMT